MLSCGISVSLFYVWLWFDCILLSLLSITTLLGTFCLSFCTHLFNTKRRGCIKFQLLIYGYLIRYSLNFLIWVELIIYYSEARYTDSDLYGLDSFSEICEDNSDFTGLKGFFDICVGHYILYVQGVLSIYISKLAIWLWTRQYFLHLG